ncbi:MAG: hypothetical protein R6V62_00900 [Candidatus Fermentibacteraceae bacterium]
MAVPRDFDAVVTSVERVCQGVLRVGFHAPGFDGAPGQFVEMEPSPGLLPMTRRPFTINRLLPTGFEVVFEVLGRGTGLLAGLKPGDEVRTLGPLGSGWRLSPGKWLLVGGGMGAAGFPFLAGSLEEPPLVLLGASTSERLLHTGSEQCTITDDGSSGCRGRITELLGQTDPEAFKTIAVCGPLPMLKAVWASIPDRYRHKVQVSTESRMGCGWGVCEGCSIPVSGGGYRKCCTDGPVFMGEELDWDRWSS